MKRVFAAIAGLLAILVMAAPGASASTSSTPTAPLTVISLTFDDGFKSQLWAAEQMKQRGLYGTFYLNSGQIGFPAYLKVDQVKEIIKMGHEIGGHTVTHDHLTKMAPARAKAEICQDRRNLSQLGVQLTSFAYPYGDVGKGVLKMARQCGYNSARGVHGLYNAPNDCGSCPVAETLPPQRPYYIRTNGAVTKETPLPELKRRVIAAERTGGWVPYFFHRIGVYPQDEVISQADFVAFLDFLKSRPNTTIVRTVDQVIGGPTRPLTAGIGPKFPGFAKQLTTSGTLTNTAAFTVLGYGIGQAQVIGFFVLAGMFSMLGYRYTHTRRRYAQS